MSKEAFIENVKKWVVLDKQLKQLNEHTKDIRQRKQNVTTDICSYMSSNSLHEKKIQKEKYMLVELGIFLQMETLIHV